MSNILLGLAIAGLVGVLLWLFASAGTAEARKRDEDAWVDPDLAEAEEEVRDLDAFTSPEDADDDLPDWGPGVPRTP